MAATSRRHLHGRGSSGRLRPRSRKQSGGSQDDQIGQGDQGMLEQCRVPFSTPTISPKTHPRYFLCTQSRPF